MNKNEEDFIRLQKLKEKLNNYEIVFNKLVRDLKRIEKEGLR